MQPGFSAIKLLKIYLFILICCSIMEFVFTIYIYIYIYIKWFSQNDVIVSLHHQVTLLSRLSWRDISSLKQSWGKSAAFETTLGQPGLTKIRDTVTSFNLLTRDRGHVFSLMFVPRSTIFKLVYFICHVVTKHDFQTNVLSRRVLPNVP